MKKLLYLFLALGIVFSAFTTSDYTVSSRVNPNYTVTSSADCDNGLDKKTINGVCETGMKTCTHSQKIGYDSYNLPLYRTFFVYKFSDGSTNYAGYSDSPMRCAFGEDPIRE